MGSEGDNLGQHQSGDQKPERALPGPALAALFAAVLGPITLWFLGRSLTEVEALAALMLLWCGLLFDVRWGVHVRLKYLWFSGNVAEGWSKKKQRQLCALTLINISLSLVATGAGLIFLLSPGRYWQNGVTLGLLLLLTAVVEATRRLIELGGPECGADVIENCRPVRWFLGPERIWNGQWGVDAWVGKATNLLPVGRRSKAVVVLVAGLALSFLTQSGVVVGRVIKGTDRDSANTPVAHRKHSVGSISRQPAGEAPATGAKPAGDPCQGTVRPGEGAPEPLKAQIRRVWEEVAPASGCAARAHPNQSGTAYIVRGSCLGEPWSLAIGSWEGGAAVLLEDASSAARSIAKHHELVGASERIDLGGGDFHLVFTPIGPYLLIREQKTDGNGGLEGTPETCVEIEPGKEHYVVLPPGMAELWIRFSREVAVSWPESTGQRGRQFVFKGLAHEELAVGSCSSPILCRVEGLGREIESSAAGVQDVTVLAVLEAGPG